MGELSILWLQKLTLIVTRNQLFSFFFTLSGKGLYHGSDVRNEVHLNICNFLPVCPKSLRSYWSETWHWSKLNSATKTKYIFSNWEVLQLKHFIVVHRSYNCKTSTLTLVKNQAFVFSQIEKKVLALERKDKFKMCSKIFNNSECSIGVLLKW